MTRPRSVRLRAPGLVKVPETPEARPTIEIEVGTRSGWGRGYGLTTYLREIDSPFMWCPFQRCLTFPISYVGDLLALIEHRDHRVVLLTAVDR